MKARLRRWSSTLQKIRHVKKTEIYLLWHLMQFHKLLKEENIKRERERENI